MDLIRKPGYETTEQLWSSDPRILQKFVITKILPFIREVYGRDFYDIGEKNPRMEHLKYCWRSIWVKQINSGDFNFDELEAPKVDGVFCFEVLEHLQNPLFFMRQLMKLTDGNIYVLMPENPRWLWHPMHFMEMKKKHFERWILNPLDLRIVRQKKILFVSSWKVYLIGLRPLLKLIAGKIKFMDIIRAMFYVQWRIYEIRKN